MRSAVAVLAAAAAPLASAALLTAQQGGALIINYCSKEIPLRNVPARGLNVENAQQDDKTLTCPTTGEVGRYFTPWVQLNVDGGWSMKLNTINSWDKIMQFEYTWVGKQIWYDMSLVDGKKGETDANPHLDFYFDAGDGVKRTNYYRYDTDDANGMQPPVATTATVTLVLCPESSGAATPTAEPTTTTTTTKSPAPAATTTPAAAYTPKSSAATTTTLATIASGANKNAVSSPAVLAVPSSSEDVETVTEYATQIVTAVVTETAHAKTKRHEHRHPHGHQH